jgi:hypothetical protein
LLFDLRQPNGGIWSGISGPAVYESPSDTYSRGAAATAGAASASIAIDTASSSPSSGRCPLRRLGVFDFPRVIMRTLFPASGTG